MKETQWATKEGQRCPWDRSVPSSEALWVAVPTSWHTHRHRDLCFKREKTQLREEAVWAEIPRKDKP